MLLNTKCIFSIISIFGFFITLSANEAIPQSARSKQCVKVYHHCSILKDRPKQTQSKIKNLGKMKIVKNDVLILEINKYGILKKKEFYNQDDMEQIKFAKNNTEDKFGKNSFIYEFLSSMRQKMNDPLGTRAKKRKEINQR